MHYKINNPHIDDILYTTLQELNNEANLVIGYRFMDDLHKLPHNIDKLTLQHFNNNFNKTIPTYVKDISVFNSENIVLFSGEQKTIKLGFEYMKKFPDTLTILPYGVENINIEVYNNNTINLDYLPDTIKTINIVIYNDKNNNIDDMNDDMNDDEDNNINKNIVEYFDNHNTFNDYISKNLDKITTNIILNKQNPNLTYIKLLVKYT